MEFPREQTRIVLNPWCLPPDLISSAIINSVNSLPASKKLFGECCDALDCAVDYINANRQIYKRVVLESDDCERLMITCTHYIALLERPGHDGRDALREGLRSLLINLKSALAYHQLYALNGDRNEMSDFSAVSPDLAADYANMMHKFNALTQHFGSSSRWWEPASVGPAGHLTGGNKRQRLLPAEIPGAPIMDHPVPSSSSAPIRRAKKMDPHERAQMLAATNWIAETSKADPAPVWQASVWKQAGCPPWEKMQMDKVVHQIDAEVHTEPATIAVTSTPLTDSPEMADKIRKHIALADIERNVHTVPPVSEGEGHRPFLSQVAGAISKGFDSLADRIRGAEHSTGKAMEREGQQLEMTMGVDSTTHSGKVGKTQAA